MFNWLKKLFHREEKSTATVAIPETPQLLEKPCRTCGKPVFYDPSWEHIPNYSALVAKVERKGRTKAKVDELGEDMIAAELGMKVFLLTDCLINKGNADINQYPHGDFDDLKTYVVAEVLR